MKMGLTTVADCRPARREELYTRPQLRQREESLRDIADTQEQASAPARAYVNGTTYFDNADWLGTERARSNVSGTRCETITSLPFGDGQTTSGSCGDPSPDHFTGKERDTESGFDYFPNRYLTSTLGRWITPDPGGKNVVHLDDPQTWNMYAYVRNNPTTRTDPSGLCDIDVGGGKTEHHWGWCVWHTLGFYQTQPEMHKEAETWRSILPGFMTKGVSDAELLRTVHLSMAMSMGGGPTGEAGALEAEGGALSDLTDPAARTHILEGDVTGGGHRPGTGISGKSEFPTAWSDEKILNEVSDVATDPASKVTRQGTDAVIEGTREGVDIRVVVRDGKIVTAYPTNLPRNP